MRLLRPIRKHEWTRDDAISIAITLGTLGIVLALGKLVVEKVTSKQLAGAEFKGTCLGFWGCTPPSAVDIVIPAILIVLILFTIRAYMSIGPRP